MADNTGISINNELQLLNIIAENIIGGLIKDIKKFFIDKIIKSEVEQIDDANRVLLLRSHFTQINNWSRQIQFYGINKPQETADFTLELDITYNIRKFMGKEYENDEFAIGEDEIISSKDNFLILGDPGSGKTTTLKRIIRKALFPKNINKPFLLLIRLKELKPTDNLSKKICEILGINYISKEVEVKKIYVDEGNIDVVRTYYDTVYFVDNLPIRTAVAELLNSIKIVLLLDGIDEINNNIKETILEELQDFTEKLSNDSKVIATCRSGDYYKSINGFNVCEISYLTPEQIKKIANFWSDEPELFLNSVSNKPYKDLCNRPLFLSQLLLLFYKYNELPERSTDIYERIVNQVVKDWDYDRNIIRNSKYSGFDTHSKIKFLNELSFILTYDIKTKIFDDKIFEQAYSKMYQKYKLPKDEVKWVSQEIESHNGLIVKSYGSYYEFSHLSLQEYMCACYLVTLQSNSNKIKAYMNEYAAPLAIAVSLSGNPANWFANLIFKTFSNSTQIVSSISLSVFLDRLLYEKPYFYEEKGDESEMGFALLYLLFNYDSIENTNLIYKLTKLENVESILVKALSKYLPEKHNSFSDDYPFVRIIFDKLYSGKLTLTPPQNGSLNKSFLRTLVSKYQNELFKLKNL